MRSASVSPSTSSITRRVDAVGLLEPVDRRDVRMIQRGEHLRLALEARQALGIAARTASGRTLIATSRSKLRVARAIHLAHAAAPRAAMISYGPSRVPGVSVIGISVAAERSA